MSVSYPLILRILASSVEASKQAGSIIRNVFSNGNLGIVEKGKNDIQTEADRLSQKYIMASLYKQYPRIAMFGEEDLHVGKPENLEDDSTVAVSLSEEVLQTASRLPAALRHISDDEVTVWVDPLDGTADFAEGHLDKVTVLIGIAVRGKATAGVVHQPYYKKSGQESTDGRTMWGVVGMGCTGLELSPPPKSTNVILTSKHHLTDICMEAVQACLPSRVEKVGGAGYKVILLLEGLASAYIFASPGSKKWDTCGPEALLHASGGRLTDVHGNDLQYHPRVTHANSGGVVATPLHVNHRWYIERIPKEVKSTLMVPEHSWSHI